MNDEEYVKFLHENTLYDDTTKAAFIEDDTAIINAFAFNFLGILGSYNAGRQVNKTPVVTGINLYFKSDKQLRISTIGDDNHNISLVLKLMSDRGMFISSSKVMEMTKFLVLAKMGQVTNVDDDIVRGWVSNIKVANIMKADPKIRSIITGFKDGKLSLIDTSKELRKQATKHVPTTTEYTKLSRRVRFRTVYSSIAGAGVGADDDDNDDDSSGAIAAQHTTVPDDVPDDVPEPEPEPEPVVKTWRDYDHMAVLHEKILTDVEEYFSTGIVGLRALPILINTIVPDIVGYEFDLDDPEQYDYLRLLNSSYNDRISSFRQIGNAVFQLYFPTISHNTPLFVMEKYMVADDTFYLQHKKRLVGMFEKYGFGEINDNNIYQFTDNFLTTDTIIKSSDLTSIIFDFTSMDLVNHIMATGDKVNSVSIERLANIFKKADSVNLNDDFIINYVETMFNKTGVLLGAFSLIGFKTNTPHESILDGTYIKYPTFNTFLTNMNRYAINAYPNTLSSNSYNNYDYDTKLRTSIRICVSPDNKFSFDSSFIDAYFVGIESITDTDEFIKTMTLVLRRKAMTVFMDDGIIKSTPFDRCVFRVLKEGKSGNIVYDSRSFTHMLARNKDKRKEIMPILHGYMKTEPSYYIASLIFQSCEDNEIRSEMSDFYTSVTTDINEEDANSAMYVMISMLKQIKSTDKRLEAFLELYKLGGKKYDFTNGDFGYDFVDRYDFGGKYAAEFLKLEVANGYRIFDADRIKAIRRRALKDRAEQMMLDMLYDSMESEPATANSFFEHLDPFYKKKIKDRITGVSFITDQIKTSTINMFGEVTTSRVKKMFEFNEINPTELMKQIKIPTKKNEPFVEYVKRVNEFSKSAQQVVPQPMVEELPVTGDQIAAISEFMIQNYYAGKHGNVYPLIKRVFTATFPVSEYNAFMKEQEELGKLKQVIPAYHGTGGIAANMILRYGFKIIPSKDKSVVGRMLGDGVYFSNKIDKILQYVSNDGYGRYHGTSGYVFEMESILGEPFVDYRSAGYAGATQRGNVISPEWAVYSPSKQLKMVRVFEVELNSHSKYKQHLSNIKSGDVTENKKMQFKNILTEAKAGKGQNYITYQFYDGLLPVENSNGSVDFVDASKYIAPKGVRVIDNGVVTVDIPAKYSAFYRYSSCKKLKNKDLDAFFKLLKH